MIDVATRIADEVLAPMAEDVDRADAVPASHLDALGQAGLFGLAAPGDAGGAGVDPATFRRVMAAIAGGCGATAFVWAQHHGVVRLVADTGWSPAGTPADDFLRHLAAGRRVAGTAFAHVRRRGAPAITARRRADGGWRLDGHAPWATSWGIAAHFSVAAETDDGRLVWSIIDAGPEVQIDGLTARPLALPVLGATRTVALDLDDVRVAEEQVARVEDAASWRAADRIRSSLGSPAPLGIAARVEHHLRRLDEPSTIGVADRLAVALEASWNDDDALLAAIGEAGAARGDLEGVDELVDRGAMHRARTVAVARTSTAALLAAVGGGGMETSRPAQRLAREADFYVIQAQTRDGRRAALAHLGADLDRLAGRA